uniref:Uncharacterized protein n=1 Tax=Glossina pallidipes TaxID=7398 RepID=A0A1B0A3K6_GLOPL
MLCSIAETLDKKVDAVKGEMNHGTNLSKPTVIFGSKITTERIANVAKNNAFDIKIVSFDNEKSISDILPFNELMESPTMCSYLFKLVKYVLELEFRTRTPIVAVAQEGQEADDQETKLAANFEPHASKPRNFTHTMTALTIPDILKILGSILHILGNIKFASKYKKELYLEGCDIYLDDLRLPRIRICKPYISGSGE